jgi:co-chaperonin GroES (HSP10)
MFVELNTSTYEGFTDSGIQILKKDFVVSPTWRNTARVIMAHPECRYVKINDMVCFKKHTQKRLGAEQGDLLVLLEHQILGIIRKGNGDVWFN